MRRPMEECEMLPFDQLNRQNHEITELCQVLGTLIQERTMCDTSVTCDLFERFRDMFKEHLDLEDKTLYSKLLAHGDKSINGRAVQQLNATKELKRIFNAYMGKWCRKGLRIDDHDAFVRETREMFGIVLERIQAETEELYPLARSLEEGPRMAVNA